MARAALRVTAAQERAYLTIRHGIDPAGRTVNVRELASAHAGLHAARLPTPYVTLRSRLPRFEAGELRLALDNGGGLVKLRTCRRTLHIYPLAEAVVPHVATLRQRLSACAALVRRVGKDPAILARVAPLVRDALAAGGLPYRELQQRVIAARPRIRARQVVLAELVRLAIKWLWESGELVYRNASTSLHRERREFHLVDNAQRLDGITTDEAVLELLRRYLRAFGPASVEDFRWWSGISRGEILPALACLRPELIDVQVDVVPSPLLLLADDEPDLLAAPTLPGEHVTLLAYEDPALKGYHATRWRYVDDQHRTTLFNSIGEVRASIAVAGRCVGTWRFDRRSRMITHDLYAPVSSAVRPELAEQLDRMAGFLRSEPC